jgi:hypothetical protein
LSSTRAGWPTPEGHGLRTTRGTRIPVAIGEKPPFFLLESPSTHA